MKKSTILLIVVLFMVIGYAAFNTTVNIYGVGKISENISDFKVYLSSLKVDNAEIIGINDAKDEFTISDVNGDVTVDIVNDSTEYDVEAYLECEKIAEESLVWTYEYTGNVQTFTAPRSGKYKLEVWGAQGGSYNGVGGSGGYSVGNKELLKSTNLYIAVGGVGKSTNGGSLSGGYNGGGSSSANATAGRGGSGGGATHIATTNRGILSKYSSYKEEVLIVAGGGGGAAGWDGNHYVTTNGGSGGGLTGESGGQGTNSVSSGKFTIAGGGTQTSGGTAGQGTEANGKAGGFGTGGASGSRMHGGGGGGWYGGGGGAASYYIAGGGGGGSGYVGGVSDGSMLSGQRTGDGFARISLLFSPVNVMTDKVMIVAQESSNQGIKSVVGKSLVCKLKLNKLSRTEKASTK